MINNLKDREVYKKRFLFLDKVKFQNRIDLQTYLKMVIYHNSNRKEMNNRDNKINTKIKVMINIWIINHIQKQIKKDKTFKTKSIKKIKINKRQVKISKNKKR